NGCLSFDRPPDNHPQLPRDYSRRIVNPDIQAVGSSRSCGIVFGGVEMIRFRSRLGLAAALCAQAISLPASAADLSAPRAPVYAKAPPIVSAGYDWSGFYAGAHAGNEWGRAHVID